MWAKGARAQALTEQQDDAGKNDDQSAQADACGPNPQRRGPWQAGSILAAAAHGHVQELLPLLGWLP